MLADHYFCEIQENEGNKKCIEEMNLYNLLKVFKILIIEYFIQCMNSSHIYSLHTHLLIHPTWRFPIFPH